MAKFRVWWGVQYPAITANLTAQESGSDTCAAVVTVVANTGRLTNHVGAKKYRQRFVASPVFDEAPNVEVSGRFSQPLQITSGDIIIANPVALNGASGQQRQGTSGEVALDLSPIIRRRKVQLVVLLAA